MIEPRLVDVQRYQVILGMRLQDSLDDDNKPVGDILYDVVRRIGQRFGVACLTMTVNGEEHYWADPRSLDQQTMDAT